MTPVQMEIMIHYFYAVEDYQRGGQKAPFIAPAVSEGIVTLLGNGLLEEPSRTGNELDPIERQPLYAITEKGKAYVELLKAVPIPVERTVYVDPRALEKRVNGITDSDFR